MKITTTHTGNAEILQVAGELDMYNSPELRNILRERIEAGATRVLIELADVTYVDSSGLGVLINATSRLVKRSGQLLLIQPSIQVRRILEATRLLSFFKIRSTLKEALMG